MKLTGILSIVSAIAVLGAFSTGANANVNLQVTGEEECNKCLTEAFKNINMESCTFTLAGSQSNPTFSITDCKETNADAIKAACGNKGCTFTMK